MLAQLQNERIYLGTQTLLIVEVDDVRGMVWPTVEPAEGLRIEPYRQPSVTRDLLSGRTSVRYHFLITAAKTGNYEIPAVSLNAGGTVQKKGPFKLQVVEAPLKFYSAQIEPQEILVGETAEVTLRFQGYRPGVEPVLPPIEGLDIRIAGPPRMELDRREGLPITVHTLKVTANKLGAYRISGITFAEVPAEPVTLTVAPFVVVETQVQENALLVGAQTLVHVLIRGLPAETALKLVAPSGLKITAAKERLRGPAGANVFSFEVTPTEPGSATIDALELPGGQKVKLAKPITLSVRQSGGGGILACRGKPRNNETVVGEPVLVDFEVFFRGDLRGAGVDLGRSGLADKEYVKVEPVNDPSYPGWAGQPIQVNLGQEQMTMFYGNGELNGQKEQLLRFALKITPLAAGELLMEDIRVILALQIKEERRDGFSFFSSSRTEQYERKAEVPPHQVIDPPGITAPPGYQGAVGESFTFVTELDRTTATAMSPLTLTMKITGASVSSRFKPPLLAGVPELSRNFDVSPTVGGGEVKDHTITFTQVIRPRGEAVAEVPALPLVFFNYKKKTYETVYSLPIPIQVSPGSLAGAATMQVTSAQPAAAAEQPAAEGHKNSGVILGANHTDLGPIEVPRPLDVPTMITILAGGPAFLLLVCTGRRMYQRRRPIAEKRQRCKSLRAALTRAAQAENPHAELANIVQEYLRVRFDLPPGELSASMLETSLAGGRDGERLSRETVELLNVLDAGRFTVGAASGEQKEQLTARARELLNRLDSARP